LPIEIAESIKAAVTDVVAVSVAEGNNEPVRCLEVVAGSPVATASAGRDPK
jgi:hypothetical protein